MFIMSGSRFLFNSNDSVHWVSLSLSTDKMIVATTTTVAVAAADILFFLPFSSQHFNCVWAVSCWLQAFCPYTQAFANYISLFGVRAHSVRLFICWRCIRSGSLPYMSIVRHPRRRQQTEENEDERKKEHRVLRCLNYFIHWIFSNSMCLQWKLGVNNTDAKHFVCRNNAFDRDMYAHHANERRANGAGFWFYVLSWNEMIRNYQWNRSGWIMIILTPHRHLLHT